MLLKFELLPRKILPLKFELLLLIPKFEAVELKVFEIVEIKPGTRDWKKTFLLLKTSSIVSLRLYKTHLTL